MMYGLPNLSLICGIFIECYDFKCNSLLLVKPDVTFAQGIKVFWNITNSFSKAILINTHYIFFLCFFFLWRKKKKNNNSSPDKRGFLVSGILISLQKHVFGYSLETASLRQFQY